MMMRALEGVKPGKAKGKRFQTLMKGVCAVISFMQGCKEGFYASFKVDNQKFSGHPSRESGN